MGMSYDSHLPQNTHVYTHMRSLSKHPRFRLLAAVDSNPILREGFSASTNLPAYHSVFNLPSQIQPDLVVVASPTETHPEVVSAILEQMQPRAILCEKPLSLNVADSKAMVAACKYREIDLFVNFIRRADPGVREVRRRIKDGTIAAPIKAVVWYSKGMLHNGSHLVDLMSYWLGSICAARVINPGREVSENDIEPDFILECEFGKAIFCAAWEESFSHYTVEMVSSNGRLRYERGGEIHWQGVEVDEQMLGYRRLTRAASGIPNDMNRYQLNVMEELACALDGESHALCSGEEALVCQNWLEKLCDERKRMKGYHG